MAPKMMMMMMAMMMTIGFLWLPLAEGGSCREAQLCCNGRDSSCVVQKAPINAIIEDLSDKPCYCDHACLKLGDCCDDFKDHCGVLDCQVGEWGAWSECDKSCGSGMMTRTRQIVQAAQNGGKHCPTLLQKRACQGYRCHGHRDKKILREMALLLPASFSHSRHNANDSSELRRNLRTRYRDSYKHNRDHEYCVEFEVIKASKACHKLPPYNLMLEGDRITVRCDLEALIQDKETAEGKQQSAKGAAATTTTTTAATRTHGYLMEDGEDNSNGNGNGNEQQLDEDEEENDTDEEEQEQEQQQQEEQEQEEENMLETEAEMGLGTETANGDNEQLKRQRQSHQRQHNNSPATSSASKRSSATAATSVPAMPQTLQQQQQQAFNSYHCRGEGLAGRTTRWSALAAPSCRGKWLRLTIGPPKKCGHAQFIFI